jgi:hypothetical protein
MTQEQFTDAVMEVLFVRRFTRLPTKAGFCILAHVPRPDGLNGIRINHVSGMRRAVDGR